MSTEAPTFENLDLKSLDGWIVEKKREIVRFLAASKGKWDDDNRVAILRSHNDELEKALKRLKDLRLVGWDQLRSERVS